jgi:hypothetical protein
MSERQNSLHDTQAEESLLGSMLLRQESAIIASESLEASDFHTPLNQRAFAAMIRLMEDGVVLDAISVAAELNDNDVMPKLLSMVVNTETPTNVGQYAKIVRDRSVARKLATQLEESLSSLRNGTNPYEESAQIEKTIGGLGSIHSSEPEAMTISELAERADAIAPVVIPGMFRQDYRTIVVGAEGLGKSLLLRTIAMSASQGVHPFTHGAMKPIRALVVDLENPAQAILQNGLGFMNFLRVSSPDFDESRLKIWRRPGGIDIRKISDRADLQREIAAHKPDLVCMGPVKKMYRRKGNESYEESADGAMNVLDDLRTKYKFALLLEHHAAKGKQGEKRDMSPMGSINWTSWPEHGVSMTASRDDPTVIRLSVFRGTRLDEILWPDRLSRDASYMFTGTWEKGIPDVLRARK